MSLSIIKPGIFDTIQDKGRYGFQHLGINPGGFMDGAAAQMANLLAGNDMGAAVIEMHFPAAAIRFEEACILVIGGADLEPKIDGREIPLLQPVWAARDSVLRFSRQKKGRWCYLAVSGGFVAEAWMNSFSTHLKAAAGGWQGRALRQGDRIAFAAQRKGPPQKAACAFYTFPWYAAPFPDPAPQEEIWILEGPEWTLMDKGSRESMQAGTFIVQPASDRMGYSLLGPQLGARDTTQMISSAVGLGTIQLLPDGQLMVLMADHQTTGGYPRIAQVIRAHISRFAQQATGSSIRFRLVSPEAAMQLWLIQYQHLQQLKYACTFKTFPLNYNDE